MLLSDIYQCAETGGGALIAAFPDKITSEICQQMITFLAADKIGVLIEAGVPEGTQVAHKHGWISEPSPRCHPKYSVMPRSCTHQVGIMSL